MQTAGLTDLQVNGYAGVDFNDAGLDAPALDHALAAMLRAGVTTCLPTIITATENELAARLQALDRAVANSRLGPLMVPGFHLEGPFLNPADGYAGCHPRSAMVPPDPDMLGRLTALLARPVLLLTLAPERDGAGATIAWARSRGMLVAIGHSAAEDADVTQAADAGATLSTHLGNGLPRMLPKFHNPLMAQLAEDRLAASFIADGIHIPVPALKVLLRAKGPERSVLVTDATAAAAAPPGVYRFAGMAIEHATDGSVRVPGQAVLAGSALCLDQAMRNLVEWGIADAAQAVRLASDNPAALLAPALAAHGLRPGHATLTWSADLRPVSVRLADREIVLR
ncbi:MAG TPA: N-acetylglucosamine-6-phosphate deacetylase [Acetobacteraceae bacterium]|jgi:N-acetylglucosamine-6-phosphate deacetylase